MLSQDNPALCEMLAKSIGTEQVVELTVRREPGPLFTSIETQDSSTKLVEAYKLHPNRIKHLARCGQGYLYTDEAMRSRSSASAFSSGRVARRTSVAARSTRSAKGASVSIRTTRFMCYGCGARGDVFEFLQRLDGKPFPTVVRELAAGVHVVIPSVRPASAEDQRVRNERAALLGACEAAAGHWQQHLWAPEGEPARAYLASRGIGEDVARSFRLGYALPEWHDLHGTLAAANVSTAVQHAAGLLAAKESPEKAPRHYDRFRERVMFPFHDPGGRVIAFGGRAVGGESGAKYLNNPETPLYRKARTLYGIHHARDTIRRTGRAILVEGYFDVLALHQAGIARSMPRPCRCGSAR